MSSRRGEEQSSASEEEWNFWKVCGEEEKAVCVAFELFRDNEFTVSLKQYLAEIGKSVFVETVGFDDPVLESWLRGADDEGVIRPFLTLSRRDRSYLSKILPQISAKFWPMLWRRASDQIICGKLHDDRLEGGEDAFTCWHEVNFYIDLSASKRKLRDAFEAYVDRLKKDCTAEERPELELKGTQMLNADKVLRAIAARRLKPLLKKSAWSDPRLKGDLPGSYSDLRNVEKKIESAVQQLQSVIDYRRSLRVPEVVQK